jgi:23S rRNA (adenine2503-C2)-methyltransferase
VEILADPKGVGITLRRIAVSTVGILPRIEEMALAPMRPKLAISLNASYDEQRSALMPINKKYPLADLLRVCRAYPLRSWEHLMFEYVLLDGFNDADDDARRVADLLRDLRARVNLIPYNSGPQLPFRAPPFERALAFQKILMDRRIPTFIRISRGQDISAACGQLSLAESGQ